MKNLYKKYESASRKYAKATQAMEAGRFDYESEKYKAYKQAQAEFNLVADEVIDNIGKWGLVKIGNAAIEKSSTAIPMNARYLVKKAKIEARKEAEAWAKSFEL